MSNTSIVDKIRVLCSQKNITLSELEKKLGFSTSSISKWSKTNPSIDKVSAIANYFNISTDYLIGRSEISTTAEQTISDPAIITIQRLRSSLSTRDNDKMMQMLQVQFAEDFPEEG